MPLYRSIDLAYLIGYCLDWGWIDPIYLLDVGIILAGYRLPDVLALSDGLFWYWTVGLDIGACGFGSYRFWLWFKGGAFIIPEYFLGYYLFVSKIYYFL